MNTSLRIASLLVFAAGSTALAQSFVGNASPSTGQSGVFAYWNFNGLSIPTASAPGAGNVPTTIASDFGTASLSLSSWGGTVDDFAGSTLNAQNSEAAGASLSLVVGGSSAPFASNGTYIQMGFSMANLSGLQIAFSTRGTASGFNSGAWSYSTDGVSFTSFGSNTATTSTTFATASVSSSGLSALDGDGTVFVRYTLSGGTNSSGNNRIDNLTFSATYAPVPEASTAAVFGGLMAFGMAAHTRRRRAS